MAKHVLWTVEETQERYEHEFTTQMGELERIEWKLRDAMDELDHLTAA